MRHLVVVSILCCISSVAMALPKEVPGTISGHPSIDAFHVRNTDMSARAACASDVSTQSGPDGVSYSCRGRDGNTHSRLVCVEQNHGKASRTDQTLGIPEFPRERPEQLVVRHDEVLAHASVA